MREIKFRIRFTSARDDYKGVRTKTIGIHDLIDCEELDIGSFGGYRIKVLSIDEYTGLKDKNGKEIYEGDIVLCEHPVISKYNIEVLFHPAWGYWQPFNGKGSVYPGSTKVIGNIYENPEMVE